MAGARPRRTPVLLEREREVLGRRRRAHCNARASQRGIRIAHRGRYIVRHRRCGQASRGRDRLPRIEPCRACGEGVRRGRQDEPSGTGNLARASSPRFAPLPPTVSHSAVDTWSMGRTRAVMTRRIVARGALRVSTADDGGRQDRARVRGADAWACWWHWSTRCCPSDLRRGHEGGRRRGRKNSRSSETRSSGSSAAGKCPPRGISVQRTML